MPLFVFTLLITLSWPSLSHTHQGKDEMNGIKFGDYRNFPTEWTLVTIRFRKDTGEMRLTYANPLALEALKSGKTNYPDGSVFAKTGVVTGADTQFESSVVPRVVRRYQLMVKNGKTYAQTDGWGYALFDADGKTYPEEPKATQMACHACHQIVENRGYVFSEMFDFTAKTKFATQSKGQSVMVFKTVSLKKLPGELQKNLDTKSVRFLSNTSLRQHVFQGTLDELKPLLEQEALRAKMPAVFVSLDNKKFSLVRQVKLAECLNELGIEVVSTKVDGTLVTSQQCIHD